MEPDISVICDRNKLTDQGCTGAPDWIVDPRSEKVLVYHLEQGKFQFEQYTFQDKVKAGIYEDLWIDFNEFEQ